MSRCPQRASDPRVQVGGHDATATLLGSPFESEYICKVANIIQMWFNI